jgi:2-polyprenyl-3-methyl-5-hydroxy-6-metoxy-1,4-benzoquinol methylase
MSASFDAAAQEYDATFSNTSIGKAQRKLVWNYLRKYLSKNWDVLELTAGTGIDAVWLSSKVKSVLVTDASAEMIKVASSRGHYPNLSYKVLDVKSVDKVSGEFDLIFSNFGGLNCLSPTEWRSFALKLKPKLLPSGEVVLVMISSNSWWERFYFSLVGKQKEANRRKNGYAEANVDGEVVPTWYYDPEEICQFFGPDFEVKNHIPIGFMLPPSYLYPAFQKIPWLIDLFYQIDRVLLANSPLSNKADHFLIHLKRK